MPLESAFASYPEIYCVFIGVLGLTVGSFLNVVCLRLPKMLEKEWQDQCCDLLGIAPAATTEPVFNLAFPASHCPKCGHAIRAWENIPVVSYVFLQGKCSGCAAPISLRYPLVETLSCMLSAMVAWRFGFSWACGAGLLLTWILLALAVIDYDTQLLPDDITLPFLWAGLLLANFDVFTNLQSAVFGAAGGYGILWTVYHLFRLATGKEGMGYGDFKLLAALGAWQGWHALPIIILLSSLAGAISGIAMVIFRKHNRQAPIPFGPFLAAAGWIYLVWGESLSSYLATSQIV